MNNFSFNNLLAYLILSITSLALNANAETKPQTKQPATGGQPNEFMLWDSAALKQTPQGDLALTLEPSTLAKISVGSVVKIGLPNKDPVSYKIEEYDTQISALKVWKGTSKKEAGNTVIINQSNKETHLIFSQNGDTYNAYIDNATGKTSITNQNDELNLAAPTKQEKLPKTAKASPGA